MFCFIPVALTSSVFYGGTCAPNEIRKEFLLGLVDTQEVQLLHNCSGYQGLKQKGIEI